MIKYKILSIGLTLFTSITAFAQSTVDPTNSPFYANMANFDPQGYIVEPGGHLIFHDGVYPVYDFNADRGVYVKTGGFLTIYSGDLTSSSATGEWNGITIDAEDVSDPNSVAFLFSRNNISISKAKIGIHCKRTTTSGAPGYAADIHFRLDNEITFATNRDYDILIDNTIDPANPKVNYTLLDHKNIPSYLIFQGGSSSAFNANIKIENTIMQNDFEYVELNSPTIGIHLNNSKLDLKHSIINKMRIGVYDENYINISGSFFDQNVFTGQYRTAELQYSKDFTLHNNDIINPFDFAHVVNSESTTLMGNRVTNCTNSIYMGLNNTNTSIQGNVFNSVASGNGSAIAVAAADNCAILGNQIKGDLSSALATALYVGYSNNVIVRGNSFKDFPVSHSLIEESFTTTICANNFYGPTSTSIHINGPLQDQGTPTLGTHNNFILSPGEYRVQSATPVVFHNTNFIPVSAQNENNTWSSNTSHMYISTSEYCAVTKEANPTEETSHEKVILSPNPFTDVLYLDNIDDLKTVKIFSMDGKLVRTISDISSEIYFDNLESGTYFIHLIDRNDKPNVQKVIKL